ncbi:MAG: phosphopentomutase [Bacteroidota bacterium]
MKPGKIVFIVLDGVGVGELPDAGAYGDAGANTLVNTARVVGSLALPHLARLGLTHIARLGDTGPTVAAEGCYGKMAARSAGKDSTTGHWELAGIITERAFPLYPRGFPRNVLEKFVTITGCRGYLGNRPASGTEIIKELGDEHVRTGFPIVYTSGDSVFQIAAHEEVIPLPRLYEICKKTRDEIAIGEHRVGRVIARPFVGTSGQYNRTANRKDFALEPPGATLLDLLMNEEVETIGIGKIDDLFCGRGLREKIHTTSNAEGIRTTLDVAGRLRRGFVMTNLVDFDMLFGHRQDPHGMARALEEFDQSLPEFINLLNEHDVFIITSDHGNDPTDRSTDHSREYVPLLCFCKTGKKNVDLGIRSSFADAGKTVAHYFGLRNAAGLAGNSFLDWIV